MAQGQGEEHNFNEDLQKSLAYAKNPIWEKIYRRAFTNFGSMTDIWHKCQAQLDGIDRVIVLTNGETINIEEKVRDKHYPDILLEIWADKKNSVKGWIKKDLRCHFIAYLFKDIEACHMLAYAPLKAAWKKNEVEWCELAAKEKDGFRFARANNDGYTSECICIPTGKLLLAMRDAMMINLRIEQ